MGADILMFNAHQVPVGRDQIQHIEMARDMAASFNHLYGEHFTLPEAVIDDNVATLPGLDGRKMSKSYDNTIPLFVPRDQLKKLVMGLLTDSRAPGEPKSTEGSALFQIYQAFASAAETAAMRQAFANGIAWGEAKQQLFERLDAEIAPMRAAYDHYMAHPEEVERILLAGAAKARAIATPFTQKLRHAVGLRHLSAGAAPAKTEKAAKSALATFKQYREKDGLFYFKLADASGQLLLQSTGFDQPKACGAAIASLQAQGSAALADLGQCLQPGVTTDTLDAAMAALRGAKN
jgi:tryptophanyl-tRNA synthetase